MSKKGMGMEKAADTQPARGPDEVWEMVSINRILLDGIRLAVGGPNSAILSFSCPFP
jgi:hypothetical protein